MLKAIATDPKTGRTILMIGLSFGNLSKFLAEPGDTYIRIDGKDTGGLPVDVMIFSGRTEADLAQQMAGAIGPETKVHVDPRLKS
jgi:hypothetical protein